VIGIFDYGVGNIKSVENALTAIGADHCRITDDNLPYVNKLIIPGVGAFPNCMAEFRSRGFDRILYEHIKKGSGVLGICVGHQMLFESSDEFELTDGLCIFDGMIERLDKNVPDFSSPMPNINWLPLRVLESKDTPDWIRDFDGRFFYFLHSYAARANSLNSRATANYNGVQFSAIASCNNIVGVQFHPEKSGKIGLMFLESFLKEGI
jgi:glutamine amidotransferase